VRPVVRPPQSVRPPASGELNSHPELSGYGGTAHVGDASRLTPLVYTMFEVQRPTQSEDMADFRSRP